MSHLSILLEFLFLLCNLLSLGTTALQLTTDLCNDNALNINSTALITVCLLPGNDVTIYCALPDSSVTWSSAQFGTKGISKNAQNAQLSSDIQLQFIDFMYNPNTSDICTTASATINNVQKALDGLNVSCSTNNEGQKVSRFFVIRLIDYLAQIDLVFYDLTSGGGHVQITFINNSACGTDKFLVTSNNCNDSNAGNSTLQTLTGNSTQAKVELSSFSIFSVTSVDHDNNTTLCQSFSFGSFSIGISDELLEDMLYSASLTFTHSVIITSISGFESQVQCSINSKIFTKAVNFECTGLNYNTSYGILFEGEVNLTHCTLPLKFIVTFDTEQLANVQVTASQHILQIQATQISTIFSTPSKSPSEPQIHLYPTLPTVTETLVTLIDSPVTSSVSCDSMCIIIIGVTVFLFAIFVIITLAVTVCCAKHFKHKGLIEPQNTINSLLKERSSTVSFRQLTLVVDLEVLDSLSAKSVILIKNLILLHVVGQGEFGLVYKGDWFADDSGKPTTVAVKTLKGDYSREEVQALLRESVKMKMFNHPNVMNLLGVCLDAGPAPYIVLPFMAGGDLLSHIKVRQSSLVLEWSADEEMVSKVRKELLSICLQITKGMNYLSGHNFVHRDLAARNCMIDDKGVIKVADFGLSEYIYEKQYFRQNKNDNLKFPIKWMALESMENAVFTEKSDVWSFGVTCWEIFSGGKQPYPGIPPLSLPRLLRDGHRMDRPINQACSDNIYDMLMLSCWRANPEDRLPFSELVTSIESILTKVARYLDFNEFVLAIDNDKNETNNEGKR